MLLLNTMANAATGFRPTTPPAVATAVAARTIIRPLYTLPQISIGTRRFSALSKYFSLRYRISSRYYTWRACVPFDRRLSYGWWDGRERFPARRLISPDILATCSRACFTLSPHFFSILIFDEYEGLHAFSMHAPTTLLFPLSAL